MRTLALLIVSVLLVGSPVAAQPAKRDSALRITSVRLGAMASGKIGVRVAFLHKLRRMTTASVAVGGSPRLALGYVGAQIVSPLRGSLVLSVCAGPPKRTASVAKFACVHRTSVATRAYIHRRY